MSSGKVLYVEWSTLCLVVDFMSSGHVLGKSLADKVASAGT